MSKLTENDYRLYLSARSPFARVVRITLEELRVGYEPVFVDVFNPTEEFLKVNPSGRVPVLELMHLKECVSNEERFVIDSNAILTFLSQKYSSHNLFAGQYPPTQNQLERLRVDGFSTALLEISVYRILEKMRPLGTQLLADLEEYEDRTDRVFRHLLPQGTYYFGEKFSVYDIRLGTALAYVDFRFGKEHLDRYPSLRGYLSNLEQRESFKKTVPKMT
ncbi:MAG: glutathione S-transferase family protein [Bacteriovoracia bacterium]